MNEIINSGNDRNVLTLANKESCLLHNRPINFMNLELRVDTVSKQFKKILKKLKLSNDFKFHYFRHSSITELIKNNVPLNIVKEIAGHKYITTTMIYSHVKSKDMNK